MRIRLFISAAAVVPALATAAAPMHLAPSTPWVVDYGDNSCRLIRRFGQGKDLVIFALESEAPGAVDMLISGKPLETLSEEVPAKFLPLQSKPMHGHVGQSTDNGDPLVLWSYGVWLLPDDARTAEEKRDEERRANPRNRPPAMSLAEQAERKAQRQAFASSITAIEIDARRSRPVILDTGSLGAAIKTFDDCSRYSLRDWGVNPDLEDKIVRPAWAPNPWSWFSSSDYPSNMVMRGQESVVKIRVLVDATGRVTKCTSISHFKEPEFNKITCAKIMQRAHFEPAELADGTKVPSYYVNKVIFRLAP